MIKQGAVNPSCDFMPRPVASNSAVKPLRDGGVTGVTLLPFSALR